MQGNISISYLIHLAYKTRDFAFKTYNPIPHCILRVQKSHFSNSLILFSARKNPVFSRHF